MRAELNAFLVNLSVSYLFTQMGRYGDRRRLYGQTAHAVTFIIPHRDSLFITTVRGTAAFLITVTGGYQCEAEACIRSFFRSFVPQAFVRPGMQQALSSALGAQRCGDGRTDQTVSALQSSESGGGRQSNRQFR